MATAVDVQDAADRYRLADSIAARLDDEGGHWLWRGPLDPKGYPRIRIAGRERLVARLVVELELGLELEPGLVVAYCPTARACVHPEHLGVMTRRERFLAGHSPPAANVRKRRCRRGHLFSALDPSGYRRCRTCEALRARERRAQAKAA
jgi:hypothetical protein